MAAFFTWFLWRFCPDFLNPEGLFPGSAEKMSIFGPIRTLFRTLFRKVLKSCQFWGRSVHFFSIFRPWSVRGPSVIRAWSVRDPCVVRAWSVRDTSVIRAWSVRGPSVIRAWSVRDPCVIRSPHSAPNSKHSSATFSTKALSCSTNNIVTSLFLTRRSISFLI